MMFPTIQRNAASSGSPDRAAAVSCALPPPPCCWPAARTGDEGTRVAGWSLIDPSQRHPIMVTQQPTTLSLRVASGSYGLSPHQRAQVISFLERYRASMRATAAW